MATDEDLDLALALSLSEAQAKGHSPSPQSIAPYAQCIDPTKDDAALAKALQEELNLEDAQRPPVSSTRPLPLPPHRAPQQHQQQPPPVGDTTRCAGCGQSLMPPAQPSGFFLSALRSPPTSVRYLTALGRHWHPQCFRCAGCKQTLGGGDGSGNDSIGSTQFCVSESGDPYHESCHRQKFDPRCDVCSGLLPRDGGRVSWQQTPFWNTKTCPSHSTDGTKRCTSCTRMQPEGAEWAQLDDGRMLCLKCLGTVIPDTASCQPLYDDVLHFYASMAMPLPARPPLMLVDDAALNDAGNRESSAGHTRGDGPIFHTRGLCLSEYSQTIQTVTWGSGPGGFGLGMFGRSMGHKEVILGPTRCQITGILVLYGLPRLLTGSIIAHELMHAWLRLSGYRDLPPQVEEGLCQLMALLWLEAQQQGGGRSGGGAEEEERLAAFLGHQIRTDTSVVYGDGLRAALDAFQKFGLQTVLAHVKQAGKLPG